MIYKNILDLIGNTPIINYQDIFIKLESFNLAGSIKDRVALKILEQLIKESKINQDSTVIEVTSGNTGIAIAMVCAIKHLKCIIVMQDNVNVEKISILKAYGAQVILTPSKLGLKYAIDYAKKLAETNKYIYLNQFENYNNVLAHETTAKEIINEFENIDYVICGIGTGGSITGISKILKEKYPNIKIIGVLPSEINHGIQGIGAGFDLNLLELSLIDKVETVSTKEAIDEFLSLSKDGLLLGISSAANYKVAKKIKKENIDKTILMISADSGHKYLGDIIV